MGRKKNMKDFFSHIKADKKEYLIEHLKNTADLASYFASSFGGGIVAEQAGLLHDLGKHTEKFQGVLEGSVHGIDHSAVGAEYYWNTISYENENAFLADDPFLAQVICNVIQSHHSDLHGALDERAAYCSDYMAYPDFSIDRNITDNHKENALKSSEELERIKEYVKDNDLLKVIPDETFGDMTAEAKMLYERMIFSCLVDADYSATAAFYEGMDYRAYKDERILDTESLLNKLRIYRDMKGYGSSDSGLNGIRNQVYKCCEKAGRELSAGLYTLTAPTGTGKTHALMKFALEQAKKNGQKRIFVVLPFLSIIEQNASEYREIFGEENCIKQDSQTEIPEEIKLYSDRWDYHIIVTTSVSFFETLCGGKASKERKLHNIADSVVVFDEAQTLPSYLLDVTMKTLDALPEYFNTTVLLSTATQPDYKLRAALHDLNITEIMPDVQGIYDEYSRVRKLEISSEVKKCSTYEELSEVYGSSQQLFVFNTTDKALKMFELLRDKYDEENCFLLSSSLCSEHKSDTIKEIKKRISEGRQCYVSATQCIEAGVDLDFPAGMRECAPLPSIIQTAGRINRNGISTGKFHVFILDDSGENGYPGTTYRNESFVTKSLINTMGLHINDNEIGDKYYRQIFSGDADENSDKTEISEAVKRLDTHRLYENYKLIENDEELNIIVPYMSDRFDSIYKELSHKDFCISKKEMMAARNMTVRLYGNRKIKEFLERHCRRLSAKSRDLDNEIPVNWYIVEDAYIYDPKEGLLKEEKEGSCVF